MGSTEFLPSPRKARQRDSRQRRTYSIQITALLLLPSSSVPKFVILVTSTSPLSFSKRAPQASSAASAPVEAELSLERAPQTGHCHQVTDRRGRLPRHHHLPQRPLPWLQDKLRDKSRPPELTRTDPPTLGVSEKDSHHLEEEDKPYELQRGGDVKVAPSKRS